MAVAADFERAILDACNFSRISKGYLQQGASD